MTRSDLIEIIARTITRETWERAAKAFSSDFGSPRERDEEMASAILAALSFAGFAVLPREATATMTEIAKSYEHDLGLAIHLTPSGLNHKTVFEKMLDAGDLAQDRAMVAAEDLAGDRG